MSPPNVLPSRPNLEHLKDQADDLRRAFARRDPDALRRVAAIEAAAADLKESDLPVARSQLVIAREYGYPSWPALKAFVESRASATAASGKETAMDKNDRLEVHHFTVRFASCLRSGVPILDTLVICAGAATDPAFKTALDDIRSKIREGETISGLFGAYPRWFDGVYVQMVSVGCESGTLDAMMEHLAAYMETDVPVTPVGSFVMQLNTMMKAGVPLEHSLGVIAEQTPYPELRKALTDVQDSVKNGETLSKGLGRHPDVFDAYVVNMVKSGEMGGNLPVILDRIAGTLQRLSAFERR